MTEFRRSDTVTEGIRVEVRSRFLERESRPEAGTYSFAYDVRVTNEAKRPAKLLSRYWLLINSEGDRKEIEGEGVAGETPTLAPGEVYEYTSRCSLDTSWGTMEGTYHMSWDDGEPFDVDVDRFILISAAAELSRA